MSFWGLWFAMNPFWNEQCPNRGPLLNHAWSTGDIPGVCAHCGGQPKWPDAAPPEPTQMEMPELDVRARLDSLGITGSWGPALAEQSDDDIRDEDSLIEPRMRDPELGDQPHGPAGGPGRSWYGDGGLNPRDLVRLGELIYREDKDGYK